jgi:hypothetical protein
LADEADALDQAAAADLRAISRAFARRVTDASEAEALAAHEPSELHGASSLASGQTTARASPPAVPRLRLPPKPTDGDAAVAVKRARPPLQRAGSAKVLLAVSIERIAAGARPKGASGATAVSSSPAPAPARASHGFGAAASIRLRPVSASGRRA